MQVKEVLTSAGKFQPYSIEIKVETEEDNADLQMIYEFMESIDGLTGLSENVSGSEEATILDLLTAVSDCRSRD